MASTYFPESELADVQAQDFGEQSNNYLDKLKESAAPLLAAARMQTKRATDAATALVAPPAPAPPPLLPGPAPQQQARPGPSFKLPDLSSFTTWNQPKAPDQQQTSGFSLPDISSYTTWNQPEPAASAASGASGTPAPMPTGQPPATGQTAPPLGPIKEGDPQGFFETAGPYARQVEQETGVPAALSLAIAANETGYGQTRYMAGANNYHGIQAQPGEPGAVPYKDWRPGAGGQQQFYDAAQRSFSSPLDGFRGFANFLTQNPRYAPALARYQQTHDVEQLAADVKDAGYAEDPAYVQKITSIMRGIPVSTGVGEVTDTRGVPLTAPQPPPAAMPEQGKGQGGAYTQQGLADAGDPDAWAKCGPVAAYQFALKTGRNPTPAEVEKLAKDAGWTPQRGMAGFQSEAKVLAGLNIAARAEDGVNWDQVITDVSRGNPVLLQLPGHEGHYITAQGYDPRTGKIDFGSTVGDLTAAKHQTQFTPTELEGLGWGTPTASLYLDNPATPAPSVVAGASSTQTAPTSQESTNTSFSQMEPPGTQSQTSPPMMLRQPLGQMTPSLNDASSASSGVSDASAPPGSVYPSSGAGGPSWQDDYTQNGQVSPWQTSGSNTFDASSGSPSNGSGDNASLSTAPGTSIASQTIPNEDQTAFPIPDYRAPASPLVTTPETDPNAGLTPPTSPYDQQQAASMEPAPDRFQATEPTATSRVLGTLGEAATATGQAIAAEATKPTDFTTPPLPSLRGLQDVQNVTGTPGTVIGRRTGEALGLTDDPILDVGGLKVSPLDVAGFIGQNVLDPTNLISGEGQAANRVATEGARALEQAHPGIIQRIASAVREHLSGNAAETAALDAERAGTGSVSAPGVFGVAPPEAGQAASDVLQPRFVPPEVRMQTTPNMEIPNDPRLAQAVEAAGGTISGRGIEIHTTRAQDEAAAGRTATRGGVFAEAVPAGGRSSYARETPSAGGVGGNQVIPPTPTLYRKPIVLDSEPGSAQGFNKAAEQLGITGAVDEQRIAALQAKTQTNLARTAPDHMRWLQDEIERLRNPEPLTSADIDQGIRAARAAGSEGSPARAQALKDLVSRYGGDPSVIDELLQIRGADHAESAWAIKENIVSTNARKQGYDGVFTVKEEMRPASEVAHLPEIQQARADYERAYAAHDEAQQAAKEANQRYWQLDNERRVDPSKTDAYYQASEDSFRTGNRAERLSTEMAQAQLRLSEAEDAARRTNKIAEILDVQQSHNPTPGAPSGDAGVLHRAISDIQSRMAEIRPQMLSRDGDPHGDLRREWIQLQDELGRRQDQLQVLQKTGQAEYGQPGYTLHPDVMPKPVDAGSTTAAATAGIMPVPVRQHTDVLASVNKALAQGAASAVSGGVGAATNQQLNPDDPNAALKGFAVGAVAPYAIARGARALAGRGAGEAEGALGVFGVGGRPKAQAAANAADPVIRNVGRQMEGDYRVVPTPDPRTRAQRLADAWTTAMTDNRAGLYRLQNSVSEAIGRPLHADEMVAQLSRVNPASTASQRLEENLKPALQKVGEDQDWLAQYLVHSHNLDVAREMGQRAYDVSIAAGKSPILASRNALLAANTRTFSGDLNLAQTRKALTDIESTVKGFPDGASRWQAVQDGAQAVWDHNRETLQRKLDAGMISQDMFNDLTQKYPRYVRTDIADYFERGSGASKPAGRTIGTSDIGIQKLDPRGTGKDRVNPLLSTIDQTYTAESAIQRNVAGKAFENLVDADPTWATTFREVVPRQGPNVGNPQTTVPGTYKLRGKEQFLTVWDGGDSRTFVIPGEFASLVQPQGGKILGDSALANGWRSMMGIYKGLITSKNPAFSLVVSPLRDAGDYAIKEMTASGNAAKIPPRTVTRTTAAGNTVTLTQSTPGPVNAARSAGAAVLSLPGVVKDYVAAVPAAFDGILQGQFKGDLAAMMQAGAGQMSRPGHTDADLRQALRELSRTGGFQVRDMADLRHVLGNVATLGAEPIGGRLEQIPRLAAARRATGRGASTTDQAMAFRDATVDFQRGGDLAKAINAVVPFFNTSMQGGAQVIRTAKQNPAAFMASMAATIGLATAGSEAWNNSDPQRAQDYKDVPDYLKKTGIVFMLPGVQGSDQRGDRRPNFAWIPTGSYGAFVGAARDAITKYGSGQGADLSTLSGWGSLAADVGGTFSPLRGDSAGGALSSLIPPPLSTAADLTGNKDLYRGSTIATDRNDQNASALAQGSAAAFNRVSGQETRPSQWDYLYRDLGGFAAGAIGEGSNMIARATGNRPTLQEDRPIQDFPVGGGIAGRIVRDNVGQGLQNSQDEKVRVPEGIRPTLQEVGLRRDQVMSVSSTLQQIPLTRSEQADWQDRTNGYVEDAVDRATRSAAYRARGADQQKIIQDAISAAKDKAGNEVLRTISPAERRQRIRDAQAQKAS